jgi:signal transduction histidine kinase
LLDISLAGYNELMKTQSLNIKSQCGKYGLSLWQCPQFLFLIMGGVIIAATLSTYFIGQNYIDDPLTVTMIIIVLVSILFIISFVITQGFERLAEANRMKSEFISIVSHQLRSPLTNLRWALDFLSSEKIEAKRFEYYEILKENSIRMGELIDNLLVVSRIEQGRLPFKKEEIDLNSLLKSIIKDSEQFAEASNVKVEFNEDKNLPKIISDSSQIRLLIDNLLANALRYSKSSGKINISLSEKNGQVIFKIQDEGIGIPKNDQKYIFQKFFRGTNAQKKQTQGTGLGLYIAKCVVEGAGGKMGFRSMEDSGAMFWFEIPVK